MLIPLEEAFNKACKQILDANNLVRVVLSGRRRNMKTDYVRIDIRPVEIKSVIQLQLSFNEGQARTVKNIPLNEEEVLRLLASGYANILIEYTSGAMSIRITKSGSAHVHIEEGSFVQNLAHDKKKVRLLDPSDPFLVAVGISDKQGILKPTKRDKYLQVEEFLRILVPALTSAIESGLIRKPDETNPLTITDLGCGHAYLTFAAHQYLQSEGINVQVIGIDMRQESRERNRAIAERLGITSTIEFQAEEIATTTVRYSDVVIALHACDTATDDAIAWAVAANAKLLLIAPCCHHDIQSQFSQSPEPWEALTKFGLLKERWGDLLTDSLRAQILRMVGYRVEIIEFIGGEHTPRNLMIRATKTDLAPDDVDIARYREICKQWKITPVLEGKIPTHFIG